MIVGTMFTLFVVPVYYSIFAAEHRARSTEAEAELDGTGSDAPVGGLVPA
jgi:hypothetical protein